MMVMIMIMTNQCTQMSDQDIHDYDDTDDDDDGGDDDDDDDDDDEKDGQRTPHALQSEGSHPVLLTH